MKKELIAYAIVIVLASLWGLTTAKDTGFANKTSEPEMVLVTLNTPSPTPSKKSASKRTRITSYIKHDTTFSRTVAKDIVKSHLKAPRTAKFCMLASMNVNDLGNGEYAVTGWVDAENSFGAMLRKTFIVTYTATQQGYKNESVVFLD